ncbi:hypothetical protein ONZ43_g1248 [Nemania bipapillata]|uniref:Uncharacterized protein n=1 Tax=Nemania bipapillata TaxID=110536 RepID=A0ACC2J567_9PEZI|nr:hypothetical protein ONZ43_g1248 [Nemania bipapillata]
MGNETPPKRMTRARAAAASAAAATLNAKVPKSDRVTKATKATAASASKTVKAAAAPAKKSTAIATKKAAVPAKKSTAAKKPAAAKKSTTKTAANTKATASASTSAPTSGTRPTTMKRKLRTFEHDDDDDEDDLSKDDNTQTTMNRPAKKLRGSTKKAVDPESESESESELESVPRSKQSKPTAKATQSTTVAPITRSTRGRPKKSTATTPAASTANPQTSSTISGTRKRKAAAAIANDDNDDDDHDPAFEQPVTKTRRGRRAAGTVTTTYTTEPTPGLKSAVSRPASKPSGVLKKTVTFEEPEKENMLHPVTTKAKDETNGATATGMKAKPVRKSGRTTRASARAAATELTEKKPLSPKKDGQNLPLSRDAGSDDELATYEKTPLKPLMKSPIKLATTVKKLELPLPENDKDENSPPSLEPTHTSVLNSPARRPPPSPFKDTMKSPAKRVEAIPSLILPSVNTEAQGAQSPSKSTMLQSPAKRPHMPLQAFQLTQDQGVATRSPSKMSLFNTPAKRPASPTKLLSSPAPKAEDQPLEATKEIRAESGAISPPEPAIVAKTLTPIQEVDHEDSIGLESPTPQLPFTGRLSAILPRHADPALKKNPLPILELPAYSPQLNLPEPEKSNNMPVGGAPKNDIDVKGLAEDSMNDSESMPQGQRDDLGGAESDQESTNLSMAETTDQLDEGFVATAIEQPLVADEAGIQEQQIDVSGTNTEERPNHDTEVDSKSQLVDACMDAKEEQAVPSAAQAAQTQATPNRVGFGLRGKDGEDGNMSDSEDELAFSNKAVTKYKGDTQASDSVPETPAPPLLRGPMLKIPESAARAANKAIRCIANGPGRGYTPLSVQLGAWRASSPLKARRAQQKADSGPEEDEDEYSLVEYNDPPTVETPAPKGFFDDEMKIRDDMDYQAAMEAFLEADIAAKFDKHDFNDLGLTNADLSMIMGDDVKPFIADQGSQQSNLQEKSVLQASHENGNENAAPIDPTLISHGADGRTSQLNPKTPKRTFASREVYTVSKVPLKRADDSPPVGAKRHCSTTSKLSLQRPAGPFSNVSFPAKHSSQMGMDGQTDESKLALATPSKPASRAAIGTPARTTRPDLNPALLRGAIVFVDVHTTEGADAGRIFVDLLNSMGARCVKSWPWNPASSTVGEANAQKASMGAPGPSIHPKIGITHVVFKDGGKRTLEKVIESNGAVKCVGVSWVLDCEKENQWLDEKDYRVDTSLIPRGGQNRRKSMEPKAIANMNGTLVTPMKANPGLSREPQTVPNNYMSRRDSTVWTRSPSEQDEDEDAPSEPSEMDWEKTETLILTPVPQTPAPEMVAQFALGISPGTPTNGSLNIPTNNNQLLMQTCPPRPSSNVNMGEALVTHEQDPFIVRLMAARRKSTQFAPKIASPLKKQWKPTD